MTHGHTYTKQKVAFVPSRAPTRVIEGRAQAGRQQEMPRLQMKQQRELLDKLLGKDRNLTVCEEHKRVQAPRRHRQTARTPANKQSAEKAVKAATAFANTKKYKLDDPSLCKHYLCGFCPYLTLQFTKNDLGLATAPPHRTTSNAAGRSNR